MKKTIPVVLLALVVSISAGYFVYNKWSSDELKPLNAFEDTYDVVVIGGEPEGVAAAVSAARNGAQTLFITQREELGGLFTYGMLNFLDIPQGHDGKSVSKGIFKEWHDLVGGGNAFGIEEAKSAFKKLVQEEENIDVTTLTHVKDVQKDSNRVTGLTLNNEHGSFSVESSTFIDATQDGDFAVMSGAPYFTGGEDIGIKDKKMAVTLMIHLTDVNWDKIRETAQEETFGPAEVTDHVAWGFSELHYEYEPKEENTRLRGFNLVKIEDEYFINALQIFGVNGLDEEERTQAIEKGKRETKHILDYLQEEFPGFEETEIASFPSELYVRETRHIKAEYQLPMSDVWTNKDHWDNIGFGGYPVDVQAQTPDDYGYVLSEPIQYAIPFRSLVPQEIEGVLITGKTAGYSSLAAGSARVVPTGMTTAEAAGAAAAMVSERDLKFHDVIDDEAFIDDLRKILADQGAYVEHVSLDYPYKDEWYDESIQTLMDYGLVVAGYKNDLHVDDDATYKSFVNMVYNGIKRADPKTFDQKGEVLQSLLNDAFNQSSEEKLDREAAASILAKVFQLKSSNNGWTAILDEGIVDEDLSNHISSEGTLSRKEMYVLGAAVIDHLK